MGAERRLYEWPVTIHRTTICWGGHAGPLVRSNYHEGYHCLSAWITRCFTLRDVPKPEPLPNEVLIHNRFVGVNFVDTQHRAGSYYLVVLPLIPGTEASGVVAAVGSDVTDFCVADIEEDPGRHFVNSMAKKYLDQDVYPWHRPGDEHVVVIVEPARTTSMG